MTMQLGGTASGEPRLSSAHRKVADYSKKRSKRTAGGRVVSNTPFSVTIREGNGAGTAGKILHNPKAVQILIPQCQVARMHTAFLESY